MSTISSNSGSRDCADYVALNGFSIKTNTRQLGEALEQTPGCELNGNNRCVQTVHINFRRGNKTKHVHVRAKPVSGHANINGSNWSTDNEIQNTNPVLRGFKIEPSAAANTKETIQIDVWETNKKKTTTDPQTDIASNPTVTKVGSVTPEIHLKTSQTVP
jgi:hypothetical protein